MRSAYRSNLSAVIKQQGRTNAWFFRKMGISESLFYRIESGSRTPTAGYRAKAAEVLGVPKALLFLPTELLDSNETLLREEAVPA